MTRRPAPLQWNSLHSPAAFSALNAFYFALPQWGGFSMETVLQEVSVSFVGVPLVTTVIHFWWLWDAMPIGMFHENQPSKDTPTIPPGTSQAMSQLSHLLFLTQNWQLPNHNPHSLWQTLT